MNVKLKEIMCKIAKFSQNSRLYGQDYASQVFKSTNVKLMENGTH